MVVLATVGYFQQADPHLGAVTSEDPAECDGLRIELRACFLLTQDQLATAVSRSSGALVI